MLVTIALSVGLVMQLATRVGPGLAGLILWGSGLVIAGAMGFVAVADISRYSGGLEMNDVSTVSDEELQET
jgi:hypothetical protein